MASNSARPTPSHDNDVEAPNEGTGLLAASDNDSQETNPSEQLWEELAQPWPSTFERSISLLASPILNAVEADHFTKSPKPGNTPLAMAARRKYRQQNLTDSPALLQPLTRHKSMDGKYQFGRPGEAQDADFASTTASLKQGTILKPIEAVQKDQMRKAKEAAEYRAKLLKKHATSKQQDDTLEKSPGFKREKDMMRRAKESKKQEKDPNREAKATFAQCVFNLCNILMGVGLLGLPFALSGAGWFGGTIALISFSWITWKTSILIGRELNGDPRPADFFDDSPFKTPLPPGSSPNARMRKPIKSFPEIARESFGETGAVILSVILYFELFSCICIFLITIGDHLSALFPSVPKSTHMVIVTIVSIFPIILLKTARLLSYLSMVGTFATISVVSAVALAAMFEGDITEEIAAKENIDNPPYHSDFKASGLPMAFGLVAYCFSGHAIVPSIYSSMQQPQQFEKMVGASYLVVFGACLLVGVSGYYMFGEFVSDQVTISLEHNSSAGIAMKVLTWLMILTAFSKITLTMFPLALGFEEIVAPYLGSEKTMEHVSNLIKLSLMILALIVSLYVPSFSLICALVGMICTMSVSVIFPAAAHYKLFGSKLGFFEKVQDVLFVVVGLIMAVVGTIVTVG